MENNIFRSQTDLDSSDANDYDTMLGTQVIVYLILKN